VKGRGVPKAVAGAVVAATSVRLLGTAPNRDTRFVGAVCQFATRIGNRDSRLRSSRVRCRNPRKASIGAFQNGDASPAFGRRRGYQLSNRVGKPLLQSVAIILCLVALPTQAAVLPEDRTDALYHGYDGGGLEVNGPSVLVRKGYKDKISVWGNYYVDHITSASIDVVTQASPYQEQRDEFSLGADYLHGKTMMGLSFTNSEESDYESNAFRFGIAQDFFGDLTTLGISYTRGQDTVMSNADPDFEEDVDRHGYRVDLSQVVTKNFILNLNYESISDEGFLNNPYRSVRYLDPTSGRGFSYQKEVYPNTKTSSATAVRGMYYLPYHASVKGEFRYYTDTWGVDGWNVELGYVHPLSMGITLEGRYRYYEQTAADFYSDLFPRQDSQNFMARDKELATFDSHTVGADFLFIQYDDFSDVRVVTAPGQEPMYELDSTVIRANLSVWY
jgi:hypothetical protein